MRTISFRNTAWRPWLGQVPLAGQRRSRRLGDAVELTDSTFSQALKAPAAVVDFWSPTCLPCMKFKPVFEDVATTTPSTILMATVNADNATATLAQYAIDSLPTQLYLSNGQEVHRTEGNISRDQLLDEIARAFPLPAPAPPPPPPDQTSPAPVPDQSQAQPAAPPPTPPDQVMPAVPTPPPLPPAPTTPPEMKLPVPTPKPATTAPAPQKQSTTAPSGQTPAAAPATGGGFLTTPVIVGGIAGIAVIVGIVIASSGK